MGQIIRFERDPADHEQWTTPAERCVRGQPEQQSWNLFTSADGKCFAGTWEAGPGCWRVAYTENEYCEILSGRSVLRSRDGHEETLAAGDRFVIPAGFEGEWDVLETTRKVYVIYQP